MEREIKFRAWDNKISKISKPFSFGHILNFCDKNGIGHMKSPDDYHKIMQFTGLKDKNGKEIYEGDILKGVSGNHAVLFKLSGGWVTDTNLPLWAFANPVVIGNIYENPELLEQTND